MIKNLNRLILSVFILTNLSMCAIAYDSEEMINIKVYEKINPAIVSIDAELPIGVSSGSGCIIKADGTIITSAHVIDGSKKIEVTTSNGHVYKAKIISKVGKNDDLVLLKIDSQDQFETITLGNSEEIKVGQKVLAIGNPFGFNGTLTQGIVSRIDYAKNKIQTDAAINPGNSGGPLINTTGEVVGINQSIYNPDNNISNIGIGFAVPINSVKDLLKSSR